jgi:hypothetical protein
VSGKAVPVWKRLGYESSPNQHQTGYEEEGEQKHKRLRQIADIYLRNSWGEQFNAYF